MAVEEIQERRAMTPHMLIGHIEAFISDNEHSGCVEYRWLADALKNDIVKIRQVRSNGLDEVNRAAVSVFRLAEIELEKARRLADIARLDAEAIRIDPRSSRVIAEEFGVHASTVQRIKSGALWS